MPGTIFAVGSLNPVKLEAVRQGIAQYFADADSVAVAVESGVRTQPVGDEETVQGAAQRARAALQAVAGATYGVGLEGGVLELKEGMFACAWCAIVDRAGALGVASTGRFQLPPQIATLVRGGMELGAADDIVFGRANSKQNEGAVGLLTHGRLTRSQLYAPAVLLALIRFVNAEHFA